MTREEIIESRKDMTDIEVVMAVLSGMESRYRSIRANLRAEHKEAREMGWDKDAVADIASDIHDLTVRMSLLQELIVTLDHRCSDYVNGLTFD